MNSSAVISRVSHVVVAVTPAICVLVARLVAPHAGPASAAAYAAPQERIAPVKPPSEPFLNGKQAALAAALKARTPRYASPFVVPVTEAAREGLLQGPKAKPVVERQIEFSITSIVAGVQTVAIINGKARRAGDVLDGGWTVAEIDASRRHAVLEHPDHGRLVLTIKTDLKD